ncbi:MAG: thioredoxin domain-containing protein [Deltaproteobacteria bacterium]|nr:thioredoxin domain-containing protein [Deltaproteobacteria bacterium]
MCRLVRSLSLLALVLLLFSCNEHPVEHCVAGQGIVVVVEPVPRKGPTHAPVELVVFGDFQCPATFYMATLLDSYALELDQDGLTDRLQLRYHHLPIEDLHSRARAAAIAAAASHRQGDDAFWQLFFHLFKPAEELEDEDILAYAGQAGLDLEQFSADLTDPAVEALVERDLALAEELGLTYTPSIILCGVQVEPQPDDLIANLDHLIRD